MLLELVLDGPKYVAIRKSLYRNKAQEYCSERYENGALCSFRNNADFGALTELIPEPTARSAVRRGLLIPHGYLHPGKSKCNSEVQSSSMIAGASLWFVVQEAWVVISLIS